MIEVNLLSVKKAFKLPTVWGIDFNVINLKMIIGAYLLTLLVPIYESQMDNNRLGINKIIEEKNLELNKVRQEGEKLEEIKIEIERFEQQERKLNEKLEVVKKIIKLRKNPMNMLYYLAKSIPEDVWVTKIAIQDDQMTISGESTSYKSIGQLIESFKSSIFFENSNIKLVDSGMKENEKGKVRIEHFTIRAAILRYE